jgi:energy-converting hydrogenase Eha subunit G
MEWAIWLTIVLTLLVFPPTRWLIKAFVMASLGLLALLIWSEPDLSD